MKTPHQITLEPWEYEHASNIGIRRYTANWEKHDAKHYDPARMEDNRTAQVAATISELAVAKHTNRYWSGHVWTPQQHNHYRNIPDVGHNIEVRRIRTRNTVAVRKHQLGKGLVLWAARPIPPEFRTVELYGWIKYDEAWEKGTPADYAPETTRLFPVEELAL
jgi:hypothetical protein